MKMSFLNQRKSNYHPFLQKLPNYKNPGHLSMRLRIPWTLFWKKMV